VRERKPVPATVIVDCLGPSHVVASSMASSDAIIDAIGRSLPMRTTINLDDDLLAKAVKLAGPLDRSALVREGLKAFIERESAKRLARLRGTQPQLEVAARRREGNGR
jgi:Arc/MetJ family transcription regulator